MNSQKAHGEIDQRHLNRKTDYLFSISLKGLVCNDKGEVLVVKETGRAWWDLPGGGMDHGEDMRQAIAREMYEEVRLEGDFDYKIIAVEEPKHLPGINVWQIRLIFKVMPRQMVFEAGDDGDDIAFVDTEQFKNSDSATEQKIYKYAQL